MRLIKACFLSCVSLLKTLQAKERILLVAALAAQHKALTLVPACPLSTNESPERKRCYQQKAFLLAATCLEAWILEQPPGKSHFISNVE